MFKPFLILLFCASIVNAKEYKDRSYYENKRYLQQNILVYLELRQDIRDRREINKYKLKEFRKPKKPIEVEMIKINQKDLYNLSKFHKLIKEYKGI